MKKFILIYTIGFLVSTCIFLFRALRNKPSTPPDFLDIFFWLFAWWFILPIFVVRWIKYKLKGESI